ncbi:MAG: hypothetical protein ACREMN_02615 [Gemmatimonadales bacterium]
MKQVLRDYVIAVGSYSICLALGLVITLTISSAVGYLPYSDRPGPGWTEPHFSVQLLWFYAGWSVLLLLPAIIYGTVVFAWVRLLQFFEAPPVILRVAGALSAAAVALVLAAGAGWYIALAAFPVFVAAGLGAGWGALLLPRYLGRRPPPRRTWVRWSANGFVLLAGISGLYWTFFAPRYAQDLRLSIVRASSEARSGNEQQAQHFEPHESALLDSVLPNRHFHNVLTGMSSNGVAQNEARMLIILTAPVLAEARLHEPKGVRVVYIQRGDQWDMVPPDAPTIKAQITIGPGSKPNEITFAWAGGDRKTYSWPD